MVTHRLCIVACGKSKVWDRDPDTGPTRARDTYIGNLARLAIRYAEKYCDRWLILSAKYGLLDPDDTVPGPYDVTPKMREGVISIEKLREQAREKGLLDHREIVVLGGRSYVALIKRALPHAEIISPLAKYRGIGMMIKALRDAIRENKPLKDA